MRAVVILLSACFFSAHVAMPAAAETIRLKNGRSIVADRVREKGNRIEYEIGDNTYAIAKSLVERIDAGGVPPPAASPRAELPVLAPSQPVERADELLARVVREGRVDTEALAALDDPAKPDQAAAAYFVAAQHELNFGSPETARRYLERAVTHLPEHAVLLEHYVAVLIQLKRYQEAIGRAEQATRLAPNSADAFGLLGLALFYSGKTEEAVKAWRKSLALRPSATVEQYLAQAERDLAAESTYGQQESGHFFMRYEGRQVSETLRRDILATLEAHYSALVNELGVAPRETIPVILYTEQAFSDVTQAPAWMGALNDGKLRIPVEGLERMTGELSRVLKHELAHSFINQITRNRCPVWLNEGVAMALEPRSAAPYGRMLAQLFLSQRHIPLNALEGSFARFSPTQATVAYLQSLAAVDYIRDTYGMSDVVRVLERIGEGSSTETALRNTVRAGYGRLEEDIGQYLKKTYGE